MGAAFKLSFRILLFLFLFTSSLKAQVISSGKDTLKLDNVFLTSAQMDTVLKAIDSIDLPKKMFVGIKYPITKQNEEHNYDESIFRQFAKYLQHPCDKDTQMCTAQVILYKLIKEDTSIAIKAVYSTSQKIDERILAHIKKKLNFIQGNLRLIMPIYFYSEESDQLTVKVKNVIKRKFKKFKRKGFILSNSLGIIWHFRSISCSRSRAIN